ncbi:MAG: transcriptional repressor [Sphingobacteriales bacterium]|nr:MAG: transcriptional repressor [Sphingobacteriales bacterium]TAF80384.1 MAG: transcriptional repressor [Sphingobacteriales bacterium]
MQANPQHNQLLVKHNLKITTPRLSVLAVLTTREMATSQPDLEQLLGSKIDRVTLYRTLSTFEKKGILHKVMGANGTLNYALCSGACTQHNHHDKHVHFNCTLCLNVYCLDKLQIPQLQIPDGFTTKKIDLMVSGVCHKCNNADSK